MRRISEFSQIFIGRLVTKENLAIPGPIIWQIFSKKKVLHPIVPEMQVALVDSKIEKEGRSFKGLSRLMDSNPQITITCIQIER